MKENPNGGWSWARGELENFLRKVFTRAKPQRTFLVVDALDECDESTVRSVVYFFDEIAQIAEKRGLDLNICMSSRHCPTISLPDCPEIVVESGNSRDICNYIRSQFRFIPPGEEATAAELEKELIEKASGVFLWVVLVVDILLADMDEGQSLTTLRQRLVHVPPRMEDLYAELCGNFHDSQRELSTKLVQWALLSNVRMTAQSLCLAVFFSTTDKPSPEFLYSKGYTSTGSPEDTRLRRLIRNSSRGLIESTKNSVQFIHETVREFFLKGPGLSYLDPTLASGPIGKSSLAIAHGCLTILEYRNPVSGFETLKEYARSNVMDHVTAAERDGISTVPFLNRLGSTQLEDWKREALQGRTILQHICRFQLASSIVEATTRGCDANERGSRESRSPLVLAIAQSRSPPIELIMTLINHGALIDEPSKHDAVDEMTPLLQALFFGHGEVALKLMERGADTNLCTSSGEGALHIVVRRADNASLVYLLEKGANVNMRTPLNSTPLHWAAQLGTITTASLLLRSGATVDATDFEGNTPLQLAARSFSDKAAPMCQFAGRAPSQYLS